MKIKFLPQNKTIEVKPGQSVLHAAQDNGIYIKSVCGGRASCAECRVRVEEGMDNCLPPAAPELALIGSGYFIDRRRLSCQMKCVGDIVIDLSEQVEKEKRLKGHPEKDRRDRAEAQSVRSASADDEG